MNAQFVQRAELAFWNVAIRTLSENQEVRYLVQKIYRLLRNKSLRIVIKTVGVAALVGFLGGFFFYGLALFIR
jgi:hypothetical protein